MARRQNRGKRTKKERGARVLDGTLAKASSPGSKGTKKFWRPENLYKKNKRGKFDITRSRSFKQGLRREESPSKRRSVDIIVGRGFQRLLNSATIKLPHGMTVPQITERLTSPEKRRENPPGPGSHYKLAD